ncbi:MAG: GNAT family N-acetyltransferase [Lachnospirales bacterium]
MEDSGTSKGRGKLGETEKIHLEDITPNNWRMGLKVKKSQRAYVSDSAGILARAYAYRENRSRAFMIYADEVPVGIGLYYDIPEWESYDLSQFFIDERYQGRGYGTAAMKQILHELQEDGRYQQVILCYLEGNQAARCFYERLGFAESDRDEDEIIMKIDIGNLI